MAGGLHGEEHPAQGFPGEGGIWVSTPWCFRVPFGVPFWGHSLDEPLGAAAAQVVGHAVGAVERGFDVEAAQVPGAAFVEVKSDAGDVDPPGGLAGKAQLVAGGLRAQRGRESPKGPPPSYPRHPRGAASRRVPVDPKGTRGTPTDPVLGTQLG